MNLKNSVLSEYKVELSRVVLGVFFLILICLSGCSDLEESSDSELKTLTVYKTSSCGCCGKWISHLQENGFSVEVVNQDSVAHIKDYYGVPQHGRSCHTAVSDTGSVFEGHIPAKWIKYYLDNEVKGTKGLVVPAMPVGSPGMEFKDRFQEYEVFTLTDAGALESFIQVKSYEEQF